MKKRIFSILTALCLCLTLLPTAAYAEDGEGETPATKTAEVSTEKELTDALAHSSNETVRLTEDIDISESLTVSRTVTLDLNDRVLTLTGKDRFITVSGQDAKVTLTDSAKTKSQRKFSINQDGVWVLDESGDKTVSGGVITGMDAVRLLHPAHSSSRSCGARRGSPS